MNTELLDEIRRLEAATETGQLFMASEGRQFRIYFYDGRIDAISSSDKELRLGHYLLQHNLVDQSELERLISLTRKKRIPLGESAVDYEILSPIRLIELLDEQAVYLFRLIATGERQLGNLDFKNTPKLFRYPLRSCLEALLLKMVRTEETSFELQSGYKVGLKTEGTRPSLPWTPNEIQVLGQLEYPRTAQQLVSDTGLAQEELSRILGRFDRIGVLEVFNGRPSSGSAMVKLEGPRIDYLIPVVNNANPNEKLEVLRREHSFVSEQFKSLKVRLHEFNAKRGVQSVLVSSPSMQDGKSLVSANLACCLAQDPGSRVLLMDCDLRNPTVNRNFGIGLEPGLIDYLVKSNMEPYCYIRRVGRLYLLTAGGLAENPIELLSMQRMQKLMEYLKEHFDWVVMDSPPLNPIADTRAIFGLSDGLILVIRRGKTAWGVIENTVPEIPGEKFMGVVLNDVKPEMFNNTLQNYGYYEYGSQHPYQSDQKVKKKRRLRGL